MDKTRIAIASQNACFAAPQRICRKRALQHRDAWTSAAPDHFIALPTRARYLRIMVSGGVTWHTSMRSALRTALEADDHNFGETPGFPLSNASFQAALVAWWIWVSPAIRLRRVNTRCAACWSVRTARTFCSSFSSRAPAEALAAARAALEPLTRTPPGFPVPPRRRLCSEEWARRSCSRCRFVWALTTFCAHFFIPACRSVAWELRPAKYPAIASARYI